MLSIASRTSGTAQVARSRNDIGVVFFAENYASRYGYADRDRFASLRASEKFWHQDSEIAWGPLSRIFSSELRRDTVFVTVAGNFTHARFLLFWPDRIAPAFLEKKLTVTGVAEWDQVWWRGVTQRVANDCSPVYPCRLYRVPFFSASLLRCRIGFKNRIRFINCLGTAIANFFFGIETRYAVFGTVAAI